MTYDALRKAGYTGDIFLIIDNEDATADDYYRIYGTDKVIMFDKEASASAFDIADTRNDRRATVYARNASFKIARDLGLTHFMQLDDDYYGFRVRRYSEQTQHYESIYIKQLDKVFAALIELLDASHAKSIALSQGGDWLGGVQSQAARYPLMRKCMNSWLLRTDTPVQFIGRMNDDVNTYTVHGSRGHLFFTCSAVQLDAAPTQKTKGGMTEMYLDTGTYMKSFYTVMMAPSFVTVRMMGQTNQRLHHNVKWDNAVPKIISDKHRKPRRSDHATTSTLT